MTPISARELRDRFGGSRISFQSAGARRVDIECGLFLRARSKRGNAFLAGIDCSDLSQTEIVDIIARAELAGLTVRR